MDYSWPDKKAIRLWQQQIKDLIVKSGRTQEYVAKRMHMSVSTLKSYLTDPDNKSHVTPSYCTKFGMATIIRLIEPVSEFSTLYLDLLELRKRTWHNKTRNEIAQMENMKLSSVDSYCQNHPEIQIKKSKLGRPKKTS